MVIKHNYIKHVLFFVDIHLDSEACTHSPSFDPSIRQHARTYPFMYHGNTDTRDASQ